MPLYEYRCQKCDVVFEEQHKIDDRESPCKEPCKECGGEIYISLNSNSIIDPMRLGVTKPSEGFRDRLREIKKKHPLGNFNIR